MRIIRKYFTIKTKSKKFVITGKENLIINVQDREQSGRVYQESIIGTK